MRETKETVDTPEECRHGFVIDGRGCAECDLEDYLEAMDEEMERLRQQGDLEGG